MRERKVRFANVWIVERMCRIRRARKHEPMELG